MIEFISGLFVGIFMGVMAICLIIIAKDKEDEFNGK